MMGSVIMWDSPRKTLRWMGVSGHAIFRGVALNETLTEFDCGQVYLLLTITSTFLPFFIGLALYYLVAPRIFETSAEEMQKKSLEYVEREKQAEKALDEKEEAEEAEEEEQEEEAESQKEAIQVKAGKDIAEKLNLVGKKMKQAGKKSLGKTNAGTTLKIQNAWDTFKTEHGAMIVVVLNDLADIHEKTVK